MTSQGPDECADTGFTGHIRVRPPLNDAERAHLVRLTGSPGTLRGTPTGRGDRDVPFARSGWQVCPGGCCLTWDPDDEASDMVLPTLRFLIDHLLRRGAKGEGRAVFDGFTFDHVLDGAVMGGAAGEAGARLVEVTGNVASERLLPASCGSLSAPPSTRSTGRTRRGRLPANVIQFRPRRA
jgi:hypothetical protein